MRPTATYRLQLHEAFTFDDARAIVPYLDALGVSHVYASPYLKARPGSRHGYDIVDHTQLNPEIGSREDFERFSASLRERGMGQILDFVPNHMGIGGDENPWWLDVLEWGESSPYAAYFDIDWRPLRRELQGKVLLPFLGDQYGNVLRNGELKLKYDDGTFSVWYYDHRYPLKLGSYATILRSTNVPALAELAAGFTLLNVRPRSLAARAVQRVQAAALRERLRDVLREPGNVAALEATLRDYEGTPGDRASFAKLNALLRVQNYRISYWKVAAEEINYRRFFDINGLAALRMENPECFAVAHRLAFDLIGEGAVDGLRIDHVDGLFNPHTYCTLLRARAEMLGQDLYLVVEKILAHGERLPKSWHVDGTTGYEYASSVGGLFVQSRSERLFDRIYARVTGNVQAFEDIVYDCKRHIMDTSLASELNVLASDLDRIAQMDPSSSDFTLYGLRSAIKEIVACFPVYRTYVTNEEHEPDDRRYIATAVSEARRRNPFADGVVYDFVERVLTGEILGVPYERYERRAVLRFAMKFQQYSSPVMAKGVEDTAFYRYNRLVSLNEVGGDPRRFGTSLASFHRANRSRAEEWPGAMVTTATHDTKRGEDARARISLLSEIPREWSAALMRWRRYNAPLHDGGVPGGNEEYLLYQVLIGAWPAELVDRPSLRREDLAPLRDRVTEYAVKSVREAKVYSSWATPDTAYEESLGAFIDAILDPSRAEPFITDFSAFMARLGPLAAWTGLAQTALKLGGPGVPDTYQGTELWDFSLVDPDNRRAVDYGARRAMLEALHARTDGAALAEELTQSWSDGRIKLYVTASILADRRRRGTAPAAYAPLFGAGPKALHVAAYAFGDAIVVVPRLLVTLLGESRGAPAGLEVWGTTSLRVPARFAGRYRNVLTGESLAVGTGSGPARVPMSELLARFSVAYLVRESATSAGAAAS